MHPLQAKEIISGVDFIPQKNFAVIFSPIVVPDIFSVKAAFEYRLHRKVNLIIPLEAKMVNYRKLIQLISGDKSLPERWYHKESPIKLGWNFDYSHRKIATGVGIKVFPFGESMHSAFFIKTIFLIGAERFNAFSAEGIRDGVIISHALTLGYNWVFANLFSLGLELGEEYDFHTNAIKKLPRLWYGFSPLLQISFGFTF
jgi:hypothetical protein